jgi:uncharacterized protein (TIGR03437 family)
MKRLLLLCVSGAVELHAQGVGYVLDSARAQLAVVDLGARRVSATVPTGSESSEMIILPNNRTAFVSNEAANTVTAIDLASNTRMAAIATGQAPGSLAVTPDGRYVYVANAGSNDLTVIDTSKRQVTATISVGVTPVHVNVSPNGRFAYAVNQDDASVSIIDVSRNQVVKTLPVGLSPRQFAIAPSQTTAYAVNSGSDSLSVIDLSRNEVTGTITVGRGPASVTFAPSGRFLYAINRDSNSISVVDIAQNRSVAQIPAGTQPLYMVVTSDSRYGYVSNQGSNSVSVLDLALNTAEDSIAVGAGPFSMVLDPNEDFLFVTNLNGGTVSVIDLNTDRVSATIAMGGIPVQFELLNAPTLLEVAPNPAAAGSQIVLNGEGFLPGSTVRLTTTSPPRTSTVPATFLDSEGLAVTLPSAGVIFVANPDGSASEELTVRAGSPGPSIFPGGVVEGAGFSRAPAPISGGSIIAVFGNFPGVIPQGAGSFPLPATLSDVTVTFQGIPAPLIFVSPGQINAVAPIRLLGTSSARVAVSVSGQTSAAETVNVAPAGPGIFIITADGAGAFLHGDLSGITSANPARRGETIVMYLTGLGETRPATFDGEPAPMDTLCFAMRDAAVSVAGRPASVGFNGLAPGYSGLYQINFDVPSSAPAGSDVPVSVSAGGRTSNSVRLAVR